MSHSRESICAKLAQFIDDETGVQIENPTEDMDLRDSLGLNSVDLVGAVMRVESHFGIRLSQGDLTQISTLGSLIDLIQAKLAIAEETRERRAA